jgi:hypothetical protein
MGGRPPLSLDELIRAVLDCELAALLENDDKFAVACFS